MDEETYERALDVHRAPFGQECSVDVLGAFAQAEGCGGRHPS
jgi:hypothetical protein